MKRFSIERLHYPEDLEDLYIFFRKAYSPSHTLTDKNFFLWQFIQSGFSNLVLKQNEEIVGHVGLIGRDYIYMGRGIKGAFLSCLIVAKDLRGRGGGALLAREAEKNRDLLYATGINKDGMNSLLAQNWTNSGNLYRWVSPYPFAKYKNQQTKEIDRFDDLWDQSWVSLRKYYGITIDRTSVYLNWRFVNHPKINYKIFGIKKRNNLYAGYIVMRLEEGDRRAVRIVDLIASDNNTKTELLKTALAYAAEKKVDFIDFFCSIKIYADSLQSFGFFGPETKETIKTPIFILPLDTNRKNINWAFKVINLEFKNIRKDDWFIVKADGDKDRPQPSGI